MAIKLLYKQQCTTPNTVPQPFSNFPKLYDSELKRTDELLVSNSDLALREALAGLENIIYNMGRSSKITF